MSDISNMSEINAFPSQPSSPDLSQFDRVFSRLAPQDIEQFQLLYQHWTLQQQINDMQQQIASVQRELAETEHQISRVHPSALALATLARLQASGVEDIDLLDRMLERGEAWLDRTIQHLEYCEQLDVIRGDYEDWCRHALEDAFSWLDSMQSDISTTSATVPDPVQLPVPTSTEEAPASATTEELILQKLLSEEAGHDSDGRIDTGNGDEQNEEDSSDVPAANRVEQPDLENTTPQGDSGEVEDNAEDKTIQEESSPRLQDEVAGRRSNFLQRFLSKLWP